MNKHKPVLLNVKESSSIWSKLEYKVFKPCTSYNLILRKTRK
jgi:hypothetical protein